MSFSKSHLFQIELAAEEAIVNIITYAYVNEQGHIEIDCYRTEPKNGILITIKDYGIPYNPIASIKNKDKDNLLEETLGGYGVFFILKVMDDVEYRREENSNILVLTKYH